MKLKPLAKAFLKRIVDGFFSGIGFSIILSTFVLIIYLIDNKGKTDNDEYREKVKYRCDSLVTVIDAYQVKAFKQFTYFIVIKNDSIKEFDDIEPYLKVYESERLISERSYSDDFIIDDKKYFKFRFHDIITEKLDSNVNCEFEFFIEKYEDSSSVL